MCSLCARKQKYPKIEANENAFLLNITVDCQANVYTLHYEYYLGDTAVGGGIVRNFDHSALKPKDILIKDFTTEDFPEGAAIDEFRIEFFMVDENKNEFMCSDIIEFGAEYGKTYSILIIGSYEGGFFAKMQM